MAGASRPSPQRPPVAEPQRGEQVQLGGVGPGVADAHTQAQVLRPGLRVVDLDVPVAVVGQRVGVEQLVLGVAEPAAGVLLDEVLVGEGALGIDVAPAHPGVRRRGVEVPPVLLGVLAVVALVAREAEDPLLEDRVLPVPERERQAQVLIGVADPTEPVLAPAVHPRAGLVVRERGPGLAVVAVVLAHGPPCALAQVGAPTTPRPAVIGEAPALGVEFGLRHGARLRMPGAESKELSPPLRAPPDSRRDPGARSPDGGRSGSRGRR